MKIAITGATGFIGRHIRNALTKTDHDVVLVVRNVEKVGDRSANEEIVVADLSQARTDWFELFGRPDAVLHLAWGGLPNYMDRYHVDVELPMQSRFLTALVNSGLKKLVVTGTCYEYGLSSGALSEVQETKPNTPYGIAKDRLQKELFELQSTLNFDLSWARIFYPYGKGQSENSLYSQLRSCANSGIKEFKLYNGESNLDFVPVETVASSLLKLLAWHGIGLVNIGSAKPRLVVDFAQELVTANEWDVSLLVVQKSDRSYESKEFWADISKLQSVENICYF